ncbi:MAG: type I glyceraldehyde-3-phosphate dehydrogenase [Spirochaetota bacterium]|nr:type I glyceraldehyde-3-phosphate dehydrogenase [Spirochaetota bacterium]
MAIKVGINGFGRIGRNILRAALENKVEGIDFVAVNDLTDAKTLGHLFKYDSILGNFKGKVEVEDDKIFINGKSIKVLKKSIDDLPWKELGVEVVVESTGLYTDATLAKKHIDNGAKKVIISAPAKNEDITMVLGVNNGMYDSKKHHIISNASCTTNCLAPIVKVLDNKFGLKQGIMTTIHSYTNDQKILDQPHKDLRRSRAAAVSMIPTSTGAAKAVGLVIPGVKGKLTGMAIRVPTPNVSLVDLTAELNTPASKEEINNAIKSASEGELKGILEYCDEPLVSADFKGNSHSSIFDALSTIEIEEAGGKGRFIKVLSWYDNEWGYSSRVVDLIKYIMH